jgi:hypothetical protein
MNALTRPGPTASQGPFETEQQARETPAARGVHEAFRADPGAGKMHPHNLAVLTAALDDAGVTLGDFDRRIVSWLAGWEPATVVVVAGLIRRAAMPSRPAGQLAALGQALADAISYREPSGFCADCEASPAGLCDDHAGDLDKTDAYLALARDLGIEVDR